LAQDYFTLAKLNSLLNNWSELAGFSRLFGLIILIPVIGAVMVGFHWLGLGDRLCKIEINSTSLN
jgi:hypothetical protein